MWCKKYYFFSLGAFAKLRKATISLVMSVCPSVPTHGKTRLPLNKFSSNFKFEYFSKIYRENSNFVKSDTNNFTQRPVYIYDHTSRNSS
jgi:hypothetical protein